jgi:hypothetical protein
MDLLPTILHVFFCKLEADEFLIEMEINLRESFGKI